ncbi:MAG: MATE family efflux transporter [Gemmatimonadaceae bacterium]|nr:MATE family efflux transporter [Gemmatimonadaceae bacterium]
MTADIGVRGGALRIPTRRELRDVARLALPIVFVQVGLNFMGTVDAAMVGRVSAVDLAAVALGNFWWITVALFGAGVIMAIDPVVSQAVGAGANSEVALGVQRGLLLALGVAVFASLCLLPTEWLLRVLRQPPEVIPLAARWVRLQVVSTFPYFIFVAIRQSLQAHHVTRPVVVAVIVGNVVNVVLNWIFIFGHLGVPPLGAEGSAISTTIGRFVMTATLVVLGWPSLRHAVRPWRVESRRWVPIARMLRVGLPIGVHQFFEVVAFGGALALIGMLGTVPLAGHEITINLAALTYMVPLGINAAAAVLVGRAIGRGDMDGARREASAALACGVGFMACAAVILVTFPFPLARAFTTDAAVIGVAATLIPIAGIFQLFDGVQGVSSGILRGAGDTRVPMLLNVLAYAVVGLPLGAWLCFGAQWGAAGMWWGLVAALVVAACALGWRVHTHLGRALTRIRVESEAPENALTANE